LKLARSIKVSKRAQQRSAAQSWNGMQELLEMPETRGFFFSMAFRVGWQAGLGSLHVGMPAAADKFTGLKNIWE